MATTLSGFSPQNLGLMRGPSQGRGDGVTEGPQTTKIAISSKVDLERLRAVEVIEKWWGSVRDRRVFHILKQAICASEYSLTQEILRKIVPAEAELLGDPAIQAKIKFRFGGEVFPPFVVFKIFTSMGSREGSRGRDGVLEGSGEESGRGRGRGETADSGDNRTSNDGRSGIKYISGRRMIRPDSEAAVDARRQMGNRKYCDQVLEDVCRNQMLRITDEIDITTMKDYMQYMSNMDESPAYQGGRGNAWRRIDLTSLPRHAPLHNLLELLERSRRGGRRVSLQRIRSLALSQPHQQQLEQLKVLSSLSETPPPWPRPTHHSSSSSRGLLGTVGSEAQRRSRQAKRRADRMRKMYKEGSRGDESEGEGLTTPTSAGEKMEEEEAWEDEVDDLYEWTQKLSFDDIR